MQRLSFGSILAIIYGVTMGSAAREYEFFSIGGTYYNAKSYCENTYGTSLATIESDQDAQNLLDTYRSASSGGSIYWIGLTDQAQEGVYVYDDGYNCGGNCAGQRYFKPGEPNNAYGAEDCVVLQGHPYSLTIDNLLNDGNCGLSFPGFVCNKPTDSCTDIDGTYVHISDTSGTYPVTITRTGSTSISIDMSSANRMTASGTVPAYSGNAGLDDYLYGSVTFPDDPWNSPYSLYYYPCEAKIYWSGPRTSGTTNIWVQVDGNGNPVSARSVNFDAIDNGFNYYGNDKTGFKIVTNDAGYVVFEALAAVVFILICINIGCCYINYKNTRKNVYKSVSYETDTDAI